MNSNLSKPWFLGIDLGTGSCKCVVIDNHANILGFGSSEYPNHNIGNKWNEQDPDSLLHGMFIASHNAIEYAGVAPQNCQAFSIGTALHSLIAVDRLNRPLTGIITWADGRASNQANAFRQSSFTDNFYAHSGCLIHPMYPIFKIRWLKEEEPRIFEQSARFISVKEYVISRLCGLYIADYNIAAGSGLLNTHTLNWDTESMEMAGIKRQQLSELAHPSQIIGSIKPQFAHDLGIAPDVPLVLGASDAVNSSIGAGAVHPWQATCMVGTSGALRLILPNPRLDPKKRTWCYAIDNEHWLVGGAINNGGIALAWLRDTLNLASPIHTPDKTISFEDLLNQAEQVNLGADGLICLPFFAGERSPNWNQNARAVFCGLTLQHDSRHLARALIEGVAFRLRSLYDAFSDQGEEILQLRASGGFTQSKLWLQVVSNTLNREILIPAWGETSSLGAALWAMIGTNVITSIEAITEIIPTVNACRPSPQESAKYQQIYNIYNEIYNALVPSFEHIAVYIEKNSGIATSDADYS